MAFLSQSFNVNELPVGTGGGFVPLPAGWYTVTITKSELKDTKAGNGQYIKMRYDVTGPTHQGRVVFGNLNIKNANPKAEEIGRQQLGELMRAIGLVQVTDFDQFIGGQLAIKLVVKDDPEYGNGNEVKGFRSVSGSAAPAAMPRGQNDPAPVASTKSAPPWVKK